MHKDLLPGELPIAREVLIIRQEDCFLPLGALTDVSGLSRRTLRTMLSDPERPLPHFRFRPEGKILVRWSEFCAWMEQFRARAAVDVEGVVQEIVTNLKGRQTRAAERLQPGEGKVTTTRRPRPQRERG